MSCLQQTGRRCGRSRHWELPQRHVDEEVFAEVFDEMVVVSIN